MYRTRPRLRPTCTDEHHSKIKNETFDVHGIYYSNETS
jgi:hypothetical protein